MKDLKNIDEKELAKFIGIGVFMLILGFAGGGVIWLLLHSFITLSYWNALALYYAIQVPLNANKISEKYAEDVREMYDGIK